MTEKNIADEEGPLLEGVVHRLGDILGDAGVLEATYTASVRRKVEHKRQSNDADTGRKVELVITTFEPSQDPALDDHLRQLLRTLHQNRVLHSEDQALDIEVNGDLEPSVDAVIAAQRAHAAGEPHVYAPEDDGDEDGGTCWCGEAFEADLHNVVGAKELPEPEPVDA